MSIVEIRQPEPFYKSIGSVMNYVEKNEQAGHQGPCVKAKLKRREKLTVEAVTEKNKRQMGRSGRG